MNYSLAKELKDAGFPLEKLRVDETNGAWTLPHLEELIEACGEAYLNLQYITIDDEGWMASKYAGQPTKFKSVGYCRTPTEAVARLWLDLNKK